MSHPTKYEVITQGISRAITYEDLLDAIASGELTGTEPCRETTESSWTTTGTIHQNALENNPWGTPDGKPPEVAIPATRVIAATFDIITTIVVFILAKHITSPLGDTWGTITAGLIAATFVALRDCINGVSPGKLLCGLRTYNEDLNQGCSLQESAKRNLPYIIVYVVAALLGLTASVALELNTTHTLAGSLLLAALLLAINIGISEESFADNCAETKVRKRKAIILNPDIDIQVPTNKNEEANQTLEERWSNKQKPLEKKD